MRSSEYSIRFISLIDVVTSTFLNKMLVKYVVLFAFLAASNAADFSSFSYSVADPYTGDYKSQFENRAGDNVNGQYSLLDADGTHRTVDYAAGAQGFNAVVRKDPAVIAAPVAYSASLVYPAPITYTGYHRAQIGL